jgi:hypothetical protein
VLTFRLANLIGGKKKSGGSREDNAALARAADFLLDLRQQNLAGKALLALTWLVALPFFLVVTLVGTKWLHQVIMESPSCVPSITHLWFSGFWLLLSYIWIIVHVAVGVVALFLERRIRRAEANLGIVEDADTLSRWGQVSRLSDYTALPNQKSAGLNSAEIAALQGLATIADEQHKCQLGCENDCAICINSFEAGEFVRTLSVCGHSFHRSCIDLWLLRRADCPLCKRSVKSNGCA